MWKDEIQNGIGGSNQGEEGLTEEGRSEAWWKWGKKREWMKDCSKPTVGASQMINVSKEKKWNLS